MTLSESIKSIVAEGIEVIFKPGIHGIAIVLTKGNQHTRMDVKWQDWELHHPDVQGFILSDLFKAFQHAHKQ